jgi:hypothetical protein
MGFGAFLLLIIFFFPVRFFAVTNVFIFCEALYPSEVYSPSTPNNDSTTQPPQVASRDYNPIYDLVSFGCYDAVPHRDSSIITRIPYVTRQEQHAK